MSQLSFLFLMCLIFMIPKAVDAGMCHSCCRGETRDYISIPAKSNSENPENISNARAEHNSLPCPNPPEQPPVEPQNTVPTDASRRFSTVVTSGLLSSSHEQKPNQSENIEPTDASRRPSTLEASVPVFVPLPHQVEGLEDELEGSDDIFRSLGTCPENPAEHDSGSVVDSLRADSKSSDSEKLNHSTPQSQNSKNSSGGLPCRDPTRHVPPPGVKPINLSSI